MSGIAHNYSQDNILKQIKCYISAIDNYYKQQESDYTSRTVQKILNQGSCFGLSVIYAIHCYLKQETQFKLMIDFILDWDRSIDSLELHRKYSATNPPLFVFFEKIASYVFSAQEPGFLEINSLQTDLFKNKNLLSVINKNNKLIHLQHAKSDAGFINMEQFSEILRQNVNNIKNNLCLIHGGGHCSVIRVVDNQWVYYDPNNSNYEKYFLINKNRELSEIIMKAHFYLENKGAMGITLFNFEDQDIELVGFSDIPLAARLSCLGLHLLIRLNPEAINNIFLQNQENKDLVKVLIYELSRVDEDGWSGFYMMVKYLPNKIDELLEYLELYRINFQSKISKPKEQIKKQDKLIASNIGNLPDRFFLNKKNMVELIEQSFDDSARILRVFKIFKNNSLNIADILYKLLFSKVRPNKKLLDLFKNRRTLLKEIIVIIISSAKYVDKLNKIIKSNSDYQYLFKLYLRNIYFDLPNYCLWQKIMRNYDYNYIKSYSEILVIHLQNNNISRYKKEIIKNILLDIAKLKSDSFNFIFKNALYKKTIESDPYLLKSWCFFMSKKKRLCLKNNIVNSADISRISL